MRNRRHMILGVLAVAVLILFAGAATAQVKRVDACSFPTICVKLTAASGPPPAGPPECWALPVLEDGWTEAFECLGTTFDYLEAENYLFSTTMTQQIVFVEKIKLAPSLDGIPMTYQIVEDIFIIPCAPRTPSNPQGENFLMSAKPPMLFLDDVTFPAITVSETEGPVEYLCAVVVHMGILTDFFGPTLPFSCDWFAVADLDSTGQFYGQAPSADLDGNGCPDSCFEPGVPGNFIARKGIDEKGAELVNYVLNSSAVGFNRVNVFEPQASSLIPPLLPGMSSGEFGWTRPWCFTITN